MTQLDLATAIEQGDVDTVAQMVIDNPTVVDSPDWTPPPLHCAVLFDQPKIVELLLDHGADLEKVDPDRNTTPLRYAIAYCKLDMIPLLLERGANTIAIQENGTSALELATAGAEGAFDDFIDLPARAEYAEVVELLKTHGVKQ